MTRRLRSLPPLRLPTHLDRREFIQGLLALGALSTAGGLLAACGKGGTHSGKADTGDSPDTGIPSGDADLSDDYSLCHDIWGGKTFDLPDADGPLYDCLVVGGGVAGLVAAWKLRQLGLSDVRVLDHNDGVGGLARSGTVDGMTYARASAYASYPYNANTRELYLDIGLITASDVPRGWEPNPDYILHPPYDRLYMDGAWYDEPLSAEGIEALPLSRETRDQLLELRTALRRLWDYEDREGRWAFNCPVEDSTEDPDIRGLDDMTLSEYIASQGWGDEMTAVFDALLASAYGLKSDRISAWAALDLLSDEMYAEGCFCAPGGNAFFTGLVADRLGAETLLAGTFVVRVQQAGDEVHVGVVQDGEVRTLRARSVVFATSQFLAPYLLPDFPEARTAIVRGMEYTPYVVANVAVSRTPAGLVYSNQLSGDWAMSDFIVADWAGLSDPSAASLDRPNVLTAYCPMEAGERGALLSSTLDEWLERVVSELEACTPGVSETVTAFHLYKWGHAFSVPPKGWVFSTDRATLKEPLGRIFFAGADVESIPTIDHAMASGFRVAQEVADTLSA